MADLSEAERKPKKRRGPGKPFPKNVSGNPGGVSKEKRDFLERLTTDDADEVYTALMDLVRKRNVIAVLRACEYIAGKPRAAKEDNEALAALTVVVRKYVDDDAEEIP